MTDQDDAREEMRSLFNLEKTGGRSDVDAALRLRGGGCPSTSAAARSSSS